MMSPVSTPDLCEELALAKAGHTHVAGVDEAGRGAWAGPVYAAAVVLPLERLDLVELLDGVRDSKQFQKQPKRPIFP